MHVIMKFPEGFNQEEYPKFKVAHCYAYIVFVGAGAVSVSVVVLTLLK